MQKIGPALAKTYTYCQCSLTRPTICGDEGNGRVQFMMFDKPVSDPTAKLLFVGQGVKGRFCVESQPDDGKTGFNHFHRVNTPATGDTSMHGAKGEEGYWMKHVAVAEFDMEPDGEHGGQTSSWSSPRLIRTLKSVSGGKRRSAPLPADRGSEAYDCSS
jgi:hypothetical protein